MSIPPATPGPGRSQGSVPPELQRVLALKRHEQPPPGYFTSFSGVVIKELEDCAPEPPPTLWERFLATVAQPVIACVYGVGLGGVIVLALSLKSPPGPDHVAADAVPNLRTLLGEAPRASKPEPVQPQVVAQRGPSSTETPVIHAGPASFRALDQPVPALNGPAKP